MSTIDNLVNLVDVTLKKHGGVSTSNEANQRVAATKADMRAEIYKLAILNGTYGLTLMDVNRRLGIKIQTASARLSEMLRDGVLIQKGEEKRESCRVLVPVYAESL